MEKKLYGGAGRGYGGGGRICLQSYTWRKKTHETLVIRIRKFLFS